LEADLRAANERVDSLNALLKDSTEKLLAQKHEIESLRGRSSQRPPQAAAEEHRAASNQGQSERSKRRRSRRLNRRLLKIGGTIGLALVVAGAAIFIVFIVDRIGGYSNTTNYSEIDR